MHYDIGNYIMQYYISNICLFGYTYPNNQLLGNIQLDELKLIFPSHDVEHLRGILVRSDNIDQAVAEVLDEDCLLITPLEGKG